MRAAGLASSAKAFGAGGGGAECRCPHLPRPQSYNAGNPLPGGRARTRRRSPCGGKTFGKTAVVSRPEKVRMRATCQTESSFSLSPLNLRNEPSLGIAALAAGSLLGA